jgi:hypothetical protein
MERTKKILPPGALRPDGYFRLFTKPR